MRNNLITVVMLAVLSNSFPQEAGKNRGWAIATYKGITLGKSKKADLLDLFGKPRDVAHPEDEYDNPVITLIAFGYENLADIPGRTVFTMKKRTGIVTSIELYPSENNKISFQRVIEIYGRNFIRRDESLGPCLTAKEIKQYGQLSSTDYPAFLIYPHRGMVIHMNGENEVQDIVFTESCP
jgi:hypothetical protein